MIISHSARFVFAAIPKTGTHSVRQALRARMVDGDLEQVGLFHHKRFPWPELAALGHGHVSLAQVRPFLGEEQFASYLKFAFVRNPFDRFISYCAFSTREEGDAFEREPQAVMRYFLFDKPPLDHLLFQPQHLFVCDGDGRLLADMLGKVETMQSSYDEICARLDVPSATLDRINSTKRRNYQEYYTETALIDAVGSLYRRDLEFFGYEFGE